MLIQDRKGKGQSAAARFHFLLRQRGAICPQDRPLCIKLLPGHQKLLTRQSVIATGMWTTDMRPAYYHPSKLNCQSVSKQDMASQNSCTSHQAYLLISNIPVYSVQENSLAVGKPTAAARCCPCPDKRT